MSRKTNTTPKVLPSAVIMGAPLSSIGISDEAEKNSKEAIEIFRGIGNAYGLCSAYANVGKALEKKQFTEDAVFWYNQSRSLSASIDNAGCEAYACIQLARVLTNQNKFAEAEAVLLRAKRLSSENKLWEKLKLVNERLDQLYAQNKNQ